MPKTHFLTCFLTGLFCTRHGGSEHCSTEVDFYRNGREVNTRSKNSDSRRKSGTENISLVRQIMVNTCLWFCPLAGVLLLVIMFLYQVKFEMIYY
jgi:hypothetical protein